ncbi:XRE family transcriptional regulator [Enterobacteriaceae bacterium ML5]|nr:XRE family transcriptional regulator [Enterobacteriaceae bacterium ML5]
MKLGEYLAKNGINQREYGALAGVTQGYVSHVVVGRHKPRGSKAVKMAAVTGYQVTPHDLNPEDYPNPTDGLPADVQSNSTAL